MKEVECDHLQSPWEPRYKVFTGINFSGGNLYRTALNINTSNSLSINNVHKNQEKVFWRASYTEIYNHADIHFFGEKFLPVSFTLEE